MRSSAAVLSSVMGWSPFAGEASCTGGMFFVAQALNAMQRSIVAEGFVRETGFKGMGSW